LNGVVLRDNAAKSGGGVGFFAQFAGQSLTIFNSQFIDHRAKDTIAGTRICRRRDRRPW